MTPEERRKKIESYGRAHEMLVTALKRFPREMWQYRAAPGSWTVHEIIIHIADSEANSFVRARRAIAEPGSGVYGYDQDVWTNRMNYHEQDPDDALELFKWLRGNTYKLLKMLPDAAWAQTYNHSEGGVTTLDEWLHTYEIHIPDHILQMEDVCANWRQRGQA